MFTGIIEQTASILERTETGITVERPQEFGNLRRGQSIAVNGACLSIVEFSEKAIRFEVIPETFSRTNLRIATVVNLERAMPVNGRLEGHLVSGHVDTTAQLLERKKENLGERFRFELPEEIAKFVVEKGSITLNGVSLTVAAVEEDNFSVAVIPHTLKHTNLGPLSSGDVVNVEVDMMVRYWWKWCKKSEIRNSKSETISKPE